MAGMRPFFLTGANAKIKVNGRTLAFATNVSYRIEVKHEDPRVLGMYEGHSLEPVSYHVSGSFSVIRYVADVKDKVGGKAPNGVANRGNGPGNFGKNSITDVASLDPQPKEFFNPKLMDRQSGFEIEVFQKVDGDDVPVAKIRGVKLTVADFQIGGKTSPATQNFAFEALYVDEDSFIAGFSGRGQQFQ